MKYGNDRKESGYIQKKIWSVGGWGIASHCEIEQIQVRHSHTKMLMGGRILVKKTFFIDKNVKILNFI